MTPLQQAIEWLEQEKPSKEEIQLSVDNLCHLLVKPPTGVSEEEIEAAIQHLMRAAGGNMIELVRPEKISRKELDYSPLVNFDDCKAVVEESAEERLKRFRELKTTLLAPF
ncbi:hypothetical protein [Pseudomonas sp. NPDC089569]|uniref:hypothetical protein n=1 Tax=Pseudomonas sp. NPDC089569 TaxID=3390722 RepID=UPI003D087618